MYTRQHPIGRYQQKPKWRGGCFFIIIIMVGLGTGFALVRDNPLEPDPTAPVDQVMDNIGTLNAIKGNMASGGNANLPNPNPTSDIRRVFLPDVVSGSIIQDVPRSENGWDTAVLQNTVGHLEGTAWLGDSGNTVLAANYEDERGEPDVFYALGGIVAGDQIIIEDGGPQNRVVYVVVDVFTTTPDDTRFANNTDTPRLTLITTDGWNPNRENAIDPIVVIAEPAS